MDKIKFHQACLIMPKMADAEYQVLCEGIKARGFDSNYPIIKYDGMILDGRHRYQACLDVGAKPIFKDISTNINPYDYVRQIHNARRHWQSEVQKGLTNEKLLEKSDEYQAELKRIQDKANAARAEAAKERPRETTETGKTVFKSQVVGSINQPLEKQKSCEIEPEDTKPKPPPKQAKTRQAKAKALGFIALLSIILFHTLSDMIMVIL
jgi:hypothetical protein